MKASRFNIQHSEKHQGASIKPLKIAAWNFSECWLLMFGILLLAANRSPAADPDTAWPALTQTTRPWCYWWWMGSAVDKTNITRQLEQFHDAGLGGVHIIPI